MLTIFSIPKAFTANTETIQLNAVQSWTLLKPACQIVLCGNDPGVKEAANEFKVRHLPNIECNEYGTPLLNSAFEEVVKIASYIVFTDYPRCFIQVPIVNADRTREVELGAVGRPIPGNAHRPSRGI